MSIRTDLKRLEAEIGDLLESHAAAGQERDLSVYDGDPVRFSSEVLGVELVGGQIEIAEAFVHDRKTVVQSCNSYGKDVVSAVLAVYWVYVCRGLALLTAPTDRQVGEIVMGYVRRFFSRSELPGDLYERALRVDRDAGVGILAFTSNDPSKFTGFHHARLAIFVTEGQGVEDFTFEAALACATSEESRLLVVGNPLSPTGRFYHVCRSAHWRTIQLSAFDHPNVIEEREIIPGAVTVDFVKDMREEYGEGSPQWTSRVLGQFPENAEDALCKREWLDAAAERWEEMKAEAEAEKEDYRLALDPARYGSDETVMAIARGGALLELRFWSHRSTMETTGRLVQAKEKLERESPAEVARRESQQRPRFVHEPRSPQPPPRRAHVREVVVDEVGIGSGVVDRLREEGHTIEAFNGGHSPSERGQGRFLNRRAEAFWHLRRLLERGLIGLPRDEKLFEELTAIHWKPTSSGLTQIESKDLTRATLGRSPDRADAASMVFESYLNSRTRRRMGVYFPGMQGSSDPIPGAGPMREERPREPDDFQRAHGFTTPHVNGPTQAHDTTRKARPGPRVAVYHPGTDTTPKEERDHDS